MNLFKPDAEMLAGLLVGLFVIPMITKLVAS